MIFLAAVFMAATSWAQNSFVTDSLDKYIVREMQKWQIPGLAVGIVKDGKVVLTKGYGYTDLTSKKQVNENTLFQIASNSKAFTGTSIALLHFQKRLSLDDKVTSWMHYFKLKDDYATTNATIRDMLTHRIGFETFQSDFLNWGCNLTRREIIYNMRNVNPANAFRAKYGYCNAGFLVAGEIIPLVTDSSWDDFVKYHFFVPLKMQRSTTVWKGIAIDDNACKPYTIADNKLVEMPYVNIDNLGPAASINSCVKDLANWLLMQLDSGKFEGKQVLPWKVLELTRTSQMLVGDQNSKLFPQKHFNTYGLGWFMEDYNGKKVISHDGGANGFVTTTCFIPELNLGITVLTNTDANSFYDALCAQIIESYMQLPYRNISELYYKTFANNANADQNQINAWRDEVKNTKQPTMQLSAYTGIFKNEVYGTVTVKEEKGMLKIYFQYHPQLVGNLAPMKDNRFLCTFSDPEYGVKVFPFETVGGKTTAVTITVNNFIDFFEYKFIKQ